MRKNTTLFIIIGVVAFVLVGAVMVGSRRVSEQKDRAKTAFGYGLGVADQSVSTVGTPVPSDAMREAKEIMPVTEEFYGGSRATPGMQPSDTGSTNDVNAAVTTPRMVIKTGQLYLVVKDVREAVQKVTAYANSHGGFVVSSETNKTGVAPYASITIRIPVAVYDSGFSDVKALGEVQSESTSGQDVTDQYVDLDSRIKNLRATESQLLEIMKRAGKISDVLEVQTQLTSVRGQIEQIQGQMKYLKDSAAMSSLTIYLSTDPSALPVVQDDADTWKPIAEIKNAFRSLLELGKTLSYGLIWLVVFIPLWLLLVGAIWIIVKLIKRLIDRLTGTTRSNDVK